MRNTAARWGAYATAVLLGGLACILVLAAGAAELSFPAGGVVAGVAAWRVAKRSPTRLPAVRAGILSALMTVVLLWIVTLAVALFVLPDVD
jgi:hypothetical protein